MDEVMMKRISFAFASLNNTLIAMNVTLQATNDLLASIADNMPVELVMEPDPDSFDEEELAAARQRSGLQGDEDVEGSPAEVAEGPAKD
jgi:hypothetical protein